MKIDRAGGPPEIPQNNDPNQIQEGDAGAGSSTGISGAPDGIEQFSRNTNPFSQDSIFSTHEHQPQGRPFTDPSFHPGKAQGRPFQDQGAPPLEAVKGDPGDDDDKNIGSDQATTDQAEAAPTDPAVPGSNGETEEAALPLNTNLPEEEN